MALKIIAVDDELEVLQLLKLMVEPLGCEVLMVKDSRDAARLLESEKFDGVVLDVRMPHMDGFELTQRIRKSGINRQVPIVMLTGLDDAATMRKGFNAGVNFFLAKPFTRERIVGLFNAARGAMLNEKRKNMRLPFRATVTCRWSGNRQGQFKTGSINVGENGMLLAPSGGLELGQEIELEFEFPASNQPVNSRAKVIRRNQPDQIAVEFVSLAAKARDAIRAYINARDRN